MSAPLPGSAAEPARLCEFTAKGGAMMSATTGDVRSCRFSSEDLRPADRIPFFCDVLSRTLARMEVEPLGERFSCNARFYRLPDLSLSWISGSAIRGTRIREMDDGSPELVLMMNLEGAATFSQRGREVAITAGSALLASGAELCRMERTTAHFLYIGVPRTVLAPMLSNPDAALMSVMPGKTETLRLLTGYVDLLINNPTLMETAELRRLAVNHVHDLIALALGATRDAAEIAVGRGLRAARMRAIKADIAQNLEGDLTVAALSMRHRISPRYIRKLFEGENTSLSQFVLGQRLVRVYRMLADPRYAGLTISGIAFAVGFGDLSTFNRQFRRRFGLTPSDVRRRAQ
jgi:AraC-like DNA-binding protein